MHDLASRWWRTRTERARRSHQLFAVWFAHASRTNNNHYTYGIISIEYIFDIYWYWHRQWLLCEIVMSGRAERILFFFFFEHSKKEMEPDERNQKCFIVWWCVDDDDGFIGFSLINLFRHTIQMFCVFFDLS